MAEKDSKCLDLIKKAISFSLYDKLRAQLQKDFDSANISMDLYRLTAPSELTSALHEKIYFLMMERFSDYLNLLYIVDVPEKAFKDIALTDVVDVAHEASFLILRREWQKVWLKYKASS